MKQIGFLLITVVSLAQVIVVSAADMRVSNLTFETAGDDCYADGSLVLPGECYALVWRSLDKVGTEFPDISIDPPDPKNPNDDFWVAHYFPAAVRESGDGFETAYCPLISLAEQEPPIVLGLNSNRQGKWSILLLDTRYLKEDGSVGCGLDPVSKLPRCINAYVPVDGMIDFKVAEEPITPKPSDDDYVGGGDFENYTPVIADMKTVLPANCPTPQFSAMSTASGEVTLSVTNTATYLAYDISMTNDLAKVHSTTNFVGGIKQGVGAEPLTWTIPVGAEKQGFFKVLPRKPDFSK